MTTARALHRSRAVLGMFALLIAAVGSVAVHAQPARAAGGVQVFVGYADTLRSNPTNFPTPWSGSPGVVFQGCQLPNICSFDAGAVRVVNNSGSPVDVSSVTIHVDGCVFGGWPGSVLQPGQQLIVTQNSTGAAFSCPPAATPGGPPFVDTSDNGPNGTQQGGCTPDGLVPTVDVTVDGTTTTYTDKGQVLNTGGVDRAVCAGNESTQWTLIGSAPCAGSSLMLAPATQSQSIGNPATVTATFTNSCNQPLQGATVEFHVISGPNTGVTGAGVTDTGGQASFTYTSVLTGPDTLDATVTNPAGTITSNPVTVEWVLGRATTVTLSPTTAINTVGTSHTVTATVRDQFGNLLGGATVEFTVTGDVNTTGSCVTASNGPDKGMCSFTYQGPILPGEDAITGCAGPNGGAPCGAATKTWVLPPSTALCNADITNGGWMIADNGDKVNFGGNAKTDQAGAPSGQQQYTDSQAGLDVHSINITAIVCTAEQADIYGTATENGSGNHLFRIRVTDPDSTGDSDTYWIFLDNYDSGQHPLGGGNVEIHST